MISAVLSQQFWLKNMYNKDERQCNHEFAPLGMERISTDEKKIEVIVCIFCSLCGLFRTKILYFDRHKNYQKQSQ